MLNLTSPLRGAELVADTYPPFFDKACISNLRKGLWEREEYTWYFRDALICVLCLCFQDQQWDYECVLNLEGKMMMMDAYVEGDEANQSLCYITCQLNQVRDL